MAVTRGGVPVRTWCWPGNTADVTMLAQVRADLRDWQLSRVVWVTDRGFASAANRRQTGGGHYIQAEKLRSNDEASAALARPGPAGMPPWPGTCASKRSNPGPVTRC